MTARVLLRGGLLKLDGEARAHEGATVAPCDIDDSN